MCLDPEDHEMLIEDAKAMDREELKAVIDYWEDEAQWSHELQILGIAKQELEQRNKDREYQIELLTKSLSASSRVGRWISSGKAFLSRFVALNY